MTSVLQPIIPQGSQSRIAAYVNRGARRGVFRAVLPACSVPASTLADRPTAVDVTGGDGMAMNQSVQTWTYG